MKLSSLVKEIPITEMQGLRIGNAQDFEAMTGVTVLIFDEGAKVGTDISGGGPASRETPLTSPITADNPINAIVLSGGSAFGLSASDGVMQYLEEHEIGYETGFAKVPLVCQSCIYDLGIGRSDIRPTAKMGYEACENAELNQPKSGIIGGGTGASVGKIYGREYATKTGIGICAVQIGELQVGAIVVLNALGDIFDPSTGEKVAGPKLPGIEGFADSREQLYKLSVKTDLFSGNRCDCHKRRFFQGRAQQDCVNDALWLCALHQPGRHDGGRRLDLCGIDRQGFGRFKHGGNSVCGSHGAGDFDSSERVRKELRSHKNLNLQSLFQIEASMKRKEYCEKRFSHILKSGKGDLLSWKKRRKSALTPA